MSSFDENKSLCVYINTEEKIDFGNEKWNNRRIEFLQVREGDAQNYDKLYPHALHTLIIENKNETII